MTFEDAIEISRSLVSAFIAKKFDRVEIVYNEFKSAIQQDVVTEQFLPFSVEEAETEHLASVDRAAPVNPIEHIRSSHI